MCRWILGWLSFAALLFTAYFVPDSYGPCAFLFICTLAAWDLI